MQIMKPDRRGQIVKFHTPFEDEDPDQLYVILEYIEDGKRTRAKIMALDTGLGFPPVSVVYVRDLAVDENQTKELDEVLRRKLF